MKILLKNLITLFTRYKTGTLLNAVGLTVAFASFMVIMMQVWYELGYDRCYPHANRIYAIYSSDSKTHDGMGTVLSRTVGEKLLQASAGIETGGCYSYTHSGGSYSLFHPEQGKESASLSAEFSTVSRSFLDVFGFETISGNLDAFTEPGTGIIPQSLAVKLFGNENAVGQTIGYNDDGTVNHLKIIAVYKDFPKNASLGNDVYTDLEDKLLGDLNNNSTVYFVKTKRDADKREIEQQLLPLVWLHAETYNQDSTRMQRVQLIGLNDLYFFNDTLSGEGGNRNVTYSLLTVALLILLIAVINFVNFAIAQAPARMRSINTQKVLGCRTRQLRINLIAEAVCLTALSFLLALLVVHTLAGTRLSSLVVGGISPNDFPGLTLISAGTALLAGLIAGIYPAFYSTSFPPAMVLKGSFAVSRSGRKLRTALVSTQFTISIALIIVAMSIHLQNKYIRNFDIGLPRENIVTLPLSELARQPGPLIDKLKSFPDIIDVTRSQNFIVAPGGTFMTRSYKNREIEFQFIRVDPNFTSFMGMHVTEGRDFEETDRQKDSRSLTFNQTAKNAAELTVPDQIEGMEIVGIVKDYHAQPLHYPVAPAAFGVNNDPSPMFYLYVKIGNPNPGPAIAFIKEAYRTLNPSGQNPEVKFMDERIGEQYQKEQNLSELVLLFSLLSILLSVIGVFGVVHFETCRRRKEIALRKVYGSTTKEILWMFNRTYIRIVLMCFVVAAPLAWYAVNRWLENFAYKMTLPHWVFAAALLIVLAVTIATISLQCYKTATQNPVKSIRTE